MAKLISALVVFIFTLLSSNTFAGNKPDSSKRYKLDHMVESHIEPSIEDSPHLSKYDI
jgi:hypothetical protein